MHERDIIIIIIIGGGGGGGGMSLYVCPARFVIINDLLNRFFL